MSARREPRRWTPLALAVGGTFFLRMAAAATGGLLAFYLARIDATLYPVSSTVVGLLTTLFYVTELGGASFLGGLGDRFGYRRLILLGPWLGGAGALLTALTTRLPLLALTRILEGGSSAASVPNTLSYISALSAASEKVRGQAVSSFEIATLGGMALGYLLAGILWDGLGRGAFLAVLLGYAAAWAVFRRLPPLHRYPHPLGEAHPQGVPWRRRLAVLGRFPELWIFLPTWLAINAVVGLWLTHAPFVMSRVVSVSDQAIMGGFSGRRIGLIFFAIGVAFSAGIYAWGRSFTRLRKTLILTVSIVGLLATAGVLDLLNRGIGPGRLLFVLLLLTMMWMSGGTPSSVGYLSEVAERAPESRGIVMGLYSTLLGLGQLSGGALGGPVVDRWGATGMIGATYLLGVLALLGAGILDGMERRRRAQALSPHFEGEGP